MSTDPSSSSASASASSPPQNSTSTFSPSTWIPKPILSFCAKFPLVILPEEKVPNEGDDEDRKRGGVSPVLWVTPTSELSSSNIDSTEGTPAWISPHPSSLRYQLLFLLRDDAAGVVKFREWKEPAEMSVPGGQLPVLHIPSSSSLLPLSEIRSYLDSNFPLPTSVQAHNGLPTSEAHTRGLAITQVILQKITPAVSSASTSSSNSVYGRNDNKLYLPPPFYQPLDLPPVIYSSLPYFVRNIYGGESKKRREREKGEKEAVEGMRTLGEVVKAHYEDEQGQMREGGDEEGKGGKWFLGASQPSPLDALIASQIYPITLLPESSPLKQALENEPELKKYVERVIEFAGERVRHERETR